MAERGNGRHARQRKGPRRAAIAWYLSMLAGLIPTAGVVEL